MTTDERRDPGPGFGLGSKLALGFAALLAISIARDIVQAHGGEIRCESPKGHGTTVWFTLPAARA